ncbi:MAG: hypothetical protein ACLP59_16965 [Bryobacteraceae bacterium]
MRNSEVRTWYRERVAEIPALNQKWIAQTVSLEERARRAWRIRYDIRIEARAMMENPSEVEDLRERDRRLYGNPNGPTFDQLVQEGLQHGLPRDQALETYHQRLPDYKSRS